jgi:hypothetical protein
MGGPPRWMGILTDADELVMNFGDSLGPPLKEDCSNQPQYQQDQKNYDQDGYHRVQHPTGHALTSFCLSTLLQAIIRGLSSYRRGCVRTPEPLWGKFSKALVKVQPGLCNFLDMGFRERPFQALG